MMTAGIQACAVEALSHTGFNHVPTHSLLVAFLDLRTLAPALTGSAFERLCFSTGLSFWNTVFFTFSVAFVTGALDFMLDVAMGIGTTINVFTFVGVDDSLMGIRPLGATDEKGGSECKNEESLNS
jgi:hypothetical protein